MNLKSMSISRLTDLRHRVEVAPKYRNPQNPEETWAGRGLRPKWLTAAIKGGKSADDFLIRGAVASKKASKPKRARKARK